MSPHRWERHKAGDEIAGYRCMRCARCGLVGFLLHSEGRDGRLQVGKEPLHASLEGVIGSQTVPMREFTPDEKDCDLQEVVNVMES